MSVLELRRTRQPSPFAFPLSLLCRTSLVHILLTLWCRNFWGCVVPAGESKEVEVEDCDRINVAQVRSSSRPFALAVLRCDCGDAAFGAGAPRLRLAAPPLTAGCRAGAATSAH